MTTNYYEKYKNCPFWTGVEYNGMYECTKYGSTCGGCDFDSPKWYRRLWFNISTDIEMWYHFVFLYQIDRFKNYLFNRKHYDLFYKKYWWDRKKRYYDDIVYGTFNEDISEFLKSGEDNK